MDQLLNPGPHRGAFVLDDEAEIGAIVCKVLATLGIAAKQFTEPLQFLLDVKRSPPDLVILDLALGRSDAVDVIRKLEVLRFAGRVLLISGRGEATLRDIEQIGRTHGLQMMPPLQKPFRVADLKAALQAGPAPATSAGEREQPDAEPMPDDPGHMLAEALRHDWLELWYQPKIDLQSLCICGAEALVRARHPERGLVEPAGLLPPAGHALYKPLTRFVVRRVVADWNAFAGRGHALKLAINVPASILGAPGFVDFIRQALPAHPQFPGLIVEVTEDEVISDIAWIHEVATQLRLYNVWISIDDFGSAYASLSRIKDLPFREVKLDRELRRQLRGGRPQARPLPDRIGPGASFRRVGVRRGDRDRRRLALPGRSRLRHRAGLYFCATDAGGSFPGIHRPAPGRTIRRPSSGRTRPHAAYDQRMMLAVTETQPSGAADGADDGADRCPYLCTALAGPKDRRLALAIIAASVLIFVCALPFVRVPLARVPAFIASYEAALAINDGITALLLFGLFTRLRSRALFVLACGYLFDALIIIPHALTFPDVFSASGLFGAGSQSTAWLYVIWHGGFPLFVLAYALLRTDDGKRDTLPGKPATAIALAVAVLVAAVCGVTVLTTAGMDLLPVLIRNGNFSPLITTGTSPIVWTLSLMALVALWWRKRKTVLELWLMVVMSAWLLDIALSAVISSSRYDLGWYAGRSYGLLAASFVLAVLLLETNWLHDGLAAARNQLAARARDLESRVRQRTDELQRTNATLTSEISERRQAEQELLRTRSFLDAIIDSLPAMLLVKDVTDGKVIYLNRAGEELTGIQRSEIVGKTVHQVMNAKDADLIELQDLKALKSGKPYEMYENALATRDQGTRLVRTKKLVVPDEHGAPQYLIGFCEDVTEQRLTEEQLRHAQKMEALGQLTGGLAHDFNNLLAIVIGNLDILSETTSADPAQQELVTSAIGAAVSGSELTRRLLAFARRQPLQPEQVDLNALIEDISQLLRRTLGENIEISLDLDRGIPRVAVDRVQLETAIANLANNARDAMPNGGRLSIATRMTVLDQDYADQHSEVVPGNYAVIEVSDGGEGMPPEVVARIFEPFYTTKGPGKGTGLGLSMVFGFIKQSGGHINVYSEVGRGTTFRLYLRPAAPVALETATDAPALQPAGDSRETILVVEDNAKLREIVVRQLSADGFDVIEADNAKRALEILALRGSVDLLFTDVVLPGDMDGCALAREVIAASPHSKVLLTSGFPGARLTEIQGLGINIRLLSKPYRRKELSRAVHETLAERSAVD